jgi:predicted secreted Zn-dependent protease
MAGQAADANAPFGLVRAHPRYALCGLPAMVFTRVALAALVVFGLTWCLAPSTTAEAADGVLPAIEAALVPAPGVRIDTHTHLYDVDGASADELVDSLRQRAPSDGTTTWAGITEWSFNATYRFRAALDGCRADADSVNVTARVKLVLPRWGAEAQAPRPLADQWRRFSDALFVHEAGHRSIAIQAAAELASTLRSLAPADSCLAFESSVKTAATAALEGHNHQQEAYDLATGHGASQGAVLPRG